MDSQTLIEDSGEMPETKLALLHNFHQKLIFVTDQESDLAQTCAKKKGPAKINDKINFETWEFFHQLTLIQVKEAPTICQPALTKFAFLGFFE